VLHIKISVSGAYDVVDAANHVKMLRMKRTRLHASPSLLDKSLMQGVCPSPGELFCFLHTVLNNTPNKRLPRSIPPWLCVFVHLTDSISVFGLGPEGSRHENGRAQTPVTNKPGSNSRRRLVLRNTDLRRALQIFTVAAIRHFSLIL
jgi:hypothetical protein